MSNAHTFRTIARLEDQMARAAMPNTAAADPVPPRPRAEARVRWSLGRRYEQKGSFTFAEVAHA